jgi:hypothetical protein
MFDIAWEYTFHLFTIRYEALAAKKIDALISTALYADCSKYRLTSTSTIECGIVMLGPIA